MKTYYPIRLVRPCCLIAAAIVCLCGGCAPLDVKDSFSIPFWSDNEKPQVPVKVVAVWVDTVRLAEGETPTRGFGGRLMFYGRKHEKPVKVDGDLVIYAFDETNRKPGDPRPDRKYVFTAEQIPIHYSRSKLGHSYSFFLPWDAPGGPRKDISLIVRFQPKGGPVVVGEQTRQNLPGQFDPSRTANRQESGSPASDNPVTQTSYQSVAGGEKLPRPRMQTATIEMPNTFGRPTPVADARERLARARYSTSAEPAQPTPAAAPSTRFSPSRSRALGAPIVQLERDRVPWQQRPAAWRSPEPASPPTANASESR